MSDQTSNGRPFDDELSPQDTQNPTVLPLHNEQESDSVIEHRDSSSAIVDAYRHGGLRHDVRRSQWAGDARRSARSPFAHSLGALTSPPSPSRIPIPTYTRAVVRHYTPLRRNSSLPRNQGMWNLHRPMESLQEEQDDDAAVEGHPARTLLRQHRNLPRNEGRMNLHEPVEDLRQEDNDRIDAPALVRSRRIWNFTEVHEAIRQNEENGYDPPTPPPPYHEAVIMPRFEVEGYQSRRSTNGGDLEAREEQATRPSYSQGFRRLDSPRTEPSRISQSTSSTSALAQNPPPPYRSSSEHSNHRATQTQNLLSQSEVRASEVFGAVELPQGVEVREATNNARCLPIESRESGSEDKDKDQTT
jgi:hypothetical protein